MAYSAANENWKDKRGRFCSQSFHKSLRFHFFSRYQLRICRQLLTSQYRNFSTNEDGVNIIGKFCFACMEFLSRNLIKTGKKLLFPHRKLSNFPVYLTANCLWRFINMKIIGSIRYKQRQWTSYGGFSGFSGMDLRGMFSLRILKEKKEHSTSCWS